MRKKPNPFALREKDLCKNPSGVSSDEVYYSDWPASSEKSDMQTAEKNGEADCEIPSPYERQ